MKYLLEWIERQARGDAAGFGIWFTVTVSIWALIGVPLAILLILTLAFVGVIP